MKTFDVPLIELSPELYPDGSFGREYFPVELVGRLRPENFDQILLHQTQSSPSGKLGVQTVHELMHSDIEDAQKLLTARTFSRLERDAQNRAAKLLEKFGVLPHGMLVGAIFGFKQIPVPIRDEQQVIETTENALAADLLPRQREVLAARFGLTDFRQQTLQDVATRYSVSPERIRQIESKALAMLRHPRFVSALHEVLTLQPNSIGQAMGYVYQREIPDVEIRKIRDQFTVEEELFIHRKRGRLLHDGYESMHNLLSKTTLDIANLTLTTRGVAVPGAPALISALERIFHQERGRVMYGELMRQEANLLRATKHGESRDDALLRQVFSDLRILSKTTIDWEADDRGITSETCKWPNRERIRYIARGLRDVLQPIADFEA